MRVFFGLFVTPKSAFFDGMEPSNPVYFDHTRFDYKGFGERLADLLMEDYDTRGDIKVVMADDVLDWATRTNISKHELFSLAGQVLNQAVFVAPSDGLHRISSIIDKARLIPRNQSSPAGILFFSVEFFNLDAQADFFEAIGDHFFGSGLVMNQVTAKGNTTCDMLDFLSRELGFPVSSGVIPFWEDMTTIYKPVEYWGEGKVATSYNPTS